MEGSQIYIQVFHNLAVTAETVTRYPLISCSKMHLFQRWDVKDITFSHSPTQGSLFRLQIS